VATGVRRLLLVNTHEASLSPAQQQRPRCWTLGVETPPGVACASRAWRSVQRARSYRGRATREVLEAAIADPGDGSMASRWSSGPPSLRVGRPDVHGLHRLAKGIFDRTAALIGLVVTSPLFVGLALAVRLTSRGGVFYRQERIGRQGRPFRMLKFRSMVVGAEGMVDHLAHRSDGNGVLFKMKDDPRVTRIGRVLRRYSLDELPQLVNVVRGDMSLVGPRPPLPSEVERYGFDMHRRFLVKPGITGLWQVSGRSDLSWDDSVRIDVRYVEDWSLTFDFMILWKTLGAVCRGAGAY
jgi:exopolysaccharide biosynthesis polyprenyl glycosylphosphotransferase